MKPIVVGIDGSPGALQAVRWAATEARIRNRPLLLVHCWLLLDALRDPAANDPAVFAAWQERADGLVRVAVDAAEAVVPEVDVHTSIRSELPTWGLLAAGEDAELMVVGARGLGTFKQLLMGSTSREIAARATCPVVVVRGAERAHGRIVVGVDGSELSLAAVQFAFTEASWRRATLVTVHACGIPHEIHDLSKPLGAHVHAIEVDDEVRVQETLAGAREDHPDVKVEETFVHDEAVPALVEHARLADLLVVGSRGHSATAGLLLGSVAHAVLRHADSPVAVVHPRARG